MQGVCAGMFHLHAESVLHRDLAARNILLEPVEEKSMRDIYMLFNHVFCVRFLKKIHRFLFLCLL